MKTSLHIQQARLMEMSFKRETKEEAAFTTLPHLEETSKKNNLSFLLEGVGCMPHQDLPSPTL